MSVCLFSIEIQTIFFLYQLHEMRDSMIKSVDTLVDVLALNLSYGWF